MAHSGYLGGDVSGYDRDKLRRKYLAHLVPIDLGLADRDRWRAQCRCGCLDKWVLWRKRYYCKRCGRWVRTKPGALSLANSAAHGMTTQQRSEQ